MNTEVEGYDRVEFVVDRNNRICEIGEGWEDAARTGGAEGVLSRDVVLNTPIELCMHDDNTQMFYDAVFKLCRLRNEKMWREYRCDSKTHKRFMRVTLIPEM